LDFDPDADLDFLKEFASDIKERIRSRKNREQLLRQMKESFSNTIQLSPPRVCVSEDAQSELERLSAEYLPGKSHSA